MRMLFVFLAAFATLAACVGAGSVMPQAIVSLYRYAGSVQCTGGGLSLPAMERQLTDAGIQVLSSACGNDGIYAAVCGAPDGRIGIFEVSAADSQASSVLGFLPLSNLSAATRAACQ